ncbi:hypothetical protein CS542_02860 [Pedobacter sp. IW39]|nr:hypothetical protein CS542_02860 [Pedobacter sp. IW39]
MGRTKSDVSGNLKIIQAKMALVQLNNDLAIANQKLNILTGLPDETVIQPAEDLKVLPVLKL